MVDGEGSSPVNPPSVLQVRFARLHVPEAAKRLAPLVEPFLRVVARLTQSVDALLHRVAGARELVVRRVGWDRAPRESEAQFLRLTIRDDDLVGSRIDTLLQRVDPLV